MTTMAQRNNAGSVPRLVWNPDNIRDVAESVGIAALNDDSVRALSQEVEYRIGQVIDEAMRFMHAGRRNILSTQDIAQALRVLDVEPLYGYESTRPLRFGEASLGQGQPLFYIEDEELEFEKLINAPLPKVPRDMSFTAHWLAIEGVQPSISQNPTAAVTRDLPLLSKGASNSNTLAALAGHVNATFKPQVKHVVSKELMLYFEKIRGAILHEDATDEQVARLRAAALASVRDEPGLHQLVPYFVQFIAEKVTHSMKSVFTLHTMMELAEAMIGNTTLYIDPSANNLSAAILTCVLGRRLGNGSPEDEKAVYDLRNFSASLLGHVANKYEKSSQHLKARLSRVCLKSFLTPDMPLGVHYGALLALTAIAGAEGIRVLVVPCMKLYDSVLVKAGGEGGTDVEMVIAAFMKALGVLSDDSFHGLTNGHDSAVSEIALQERVGDIMGRRIAASGDERLARAVMECSI